MATARRRESMIALRAMHQAFKIACDVGYAPIDATRASCTACGGELDWRHNTVGSVIMCIRCGVTSDIPPHLRTLVPPPPQPPWRPLRFWYGALHFIREPDYGPVPKCLAAFFVLCVFAVLGTMAYTVISLRSH